MAGVVRDLMEPEPGRHFRLDHDAGDDAVLALLEPSNNVWSLTVLVGPLSLPSVGEGALLRGRSSSIVNQVNKCACRLSVFVETERQCDLAVLGEPSSTRQVTQQKPGAVAVMSQTPTVVSRREPIGPSYSRCRCMARPGLRSMRSSSRIVWSSTPARYSMRSSWRGWPNTSR